MTKVQNSQPPRDGGKVFIEAEIPATDYVQLTRAARSLGVTVEELFRRIVRESLDRPADWRD